MVNFSPNQKNFLSKPFLANISVINSRNKLPIVFPARIVEYNDKLYFATLSTAKKVKHLEKDNSIGLNIVDPSGFPYLGVSGISRFIQTSEPGYENLLDDLTNKYNPNEETEGNPNQLERIIIEITPLSIYGEIINNHERSDWN